VPVKTKTNAVELTSTNRFGAPCRAVVVREWINFSSLFKADLLYSLWLLESRFENFRDFADA